MSDARTLHQMNVHCSINMYVYIMRCVFHAAKLKQHISLMKFLKMAFVMSLLCYQPQVICKPSSLNMIDTVYKYPHLHLLAALLLELIPERCNILETKWVMPDGRELDEASQVYCNEDTAIPGCMQLLITTG